MEIYHINRLINILFNVSIMKYFSVQHIYICLQPMNLIKYKYIMHPHNYSIYLLLISLGLGDLGLSLGYDTNGQDCQFQMCEQYVRWGEMVADKGDAQRHIIVYNFIFKHINELMNIMYVRIVLVQHRFGSWTKFCKNIGLGLMFLVLPGPMFF